MSVLWAGPFTHHQLLLRQDWSRAETYPWPALWLQHAAHALLVFLVFVAWRSAHWASATVEALPAVLGTEIVVVAATMGDADVYAHCWRLVEGAAID